MRHVLAVLTVANILNYLDRKLVEAVRPSIAAAWSLNEFQSGLLVAAFVVGYAVFSPVVGWCGGRFSQRRTMALGIGVWSLGTIATGLAGGMASFAFWRIVVGVGEAIFATISVSYLRDSLGDAQAVNRAFSIFYGAIPVGSALGYVVGGFVAAHSNWQNAFFLGGIPGLLICGLVLALPPATYGRPAAPSASDDGGVFEERLRPLLTNPGYVGAVVGYVANTFALQGIAANIVSHGLHLGFAQESIAAAFGGTLVVSGFVGTLGGGALCSRVTRAASSVEGGMLAFCGVTALLAAPILAVALSVSDRTVFIALCFVAELLIFAGTAPINSVLVVIVPKPLVALGQGITIASINVFGSFMAPVIIGLIADRSSVAAAMQLCTVALAVSGGVWMMTAQTVRRQYAKCC
jgi:MFS family permease